MGTPKEDLEAFETYYLLGKNRPGSGILVLCSWSALYLKATADMANMTSPIIAVFDFQFAGCAYQPPAGDQTCLGYLDGLANTIKLLRYADEPTGLCLHHPYLLRISSRAVVLNRRRVFQVGLHIAVGADICWLSERMGVISKQINYDADILDFQMKT